MHNSYYSRMSNQDDNTQEFPTSSSKIIHISNSTLDEKIQLLKYIFNI